MLLLAGSSETQLTHRGAFQELDAISLLTPHTKLAVRPPSLESIPSVLQNAYRTSWYGRPGTGFMDLPADLIKGSVENAEDMQIVPDSPAPGAEETTLFKIAQLIKTAKAPLVVIGKGAAYAHAESAIRILVSKAHLPFLPTPMGTRETAAAPPHNTARARSTALHEADIVLLLGARLNWILHFGDPPKWNPSAQFIQIDIDPFTLGHNNPTPHLCIHGDLRTVVPQLVSALGTWHYDPTVSPYSAHLSASKTKNLASASAKATHPSLPMTHARALSTIETVLHRLSPPDEGGVVYVSEGANTMDMSRSIFPVSYPRLRLDAGTYATMGVGMGYAIAAHEAYNAPAAEAKSGPPGSGRKKIVALEGDSAFGFSAMEVETMSRYGMDILIFVLNNGGVYHGDSDSADEWLAIQKVTTQHTSQQQQPPSNEKSDEKAGLRSTSLGFGVRYEKLAEACGGVGYLVRTPEELARATEEGFREGRVCVVNVVIEAGKKGKLEFGWQASGGGKEGRKKIREEGAKL